MGDRSNPIKFGPEWLRNLAPEPRGSGRPGSSLSNQNIQSSPVAAGTASAAAVAGSSGGNTYANSPGPAGASACDTETIQQQKLNLSKLRYGREEMLALFDTSTEPPVELKNIELIYQARGKQPFALQNFDNGMRDNMRGGPSGNPFRGTSRSMTRGMNMGDGRGRPRAPFVRVPQAVSSPRNSAYGGPDDESTLRPWTGSNGSPGVSRSTSEPAEWTPNKLFRSTRKGNNTNWRQTSRDEGDEWRSAEGARPRPTQQQDKWERDWGDRPTQEKHTWHTNRRPWGDQQNHEDNLPEWAMDNAEACGGTFDSSGAFHGYSNDDSNLPRPQETTYPLARSQTHGSFVRSKTVEEGSDEWWASEKAKKLSPKRFEAGDVKFKKGAGNNQDRSSSPPLASHQSANGDDLQSPEQLASSPPPHDSSGNKQAKFADNKNYAMEETNDEPGNFQSVMINTNNGLRQKHQNIVASVGEAASGSKQSRKHGIVNVQRVQAENEQGRKQNQSIEKIHLAEEEEHLQKLPTTPSSSNAGVPMGMPQMVNAMAQMRFSPGIQNQVNLSNMGNNLPMGMPNMQNVGLQGLQVMSSMANMQQMQTNHPGLQGTMQQQAGMQSAMQGLQSNRQNTGLPTNLQNTGLHSNMQNSGLQTNMQSGGLPSNLQNSGLPSNMQNTGLPSNMQNTGLNSNMQNTGLASNMQSTGLPSNMQSPGLQNQGMTPTSQIQHMQNAAMQSNIQNSMQPNLQGLQNQMQSGMKHNQMQSSAMPGIANSTLNASLGLPIGPSNSSMSISHMQGMPQPMPNSGLSNQGLNSPMQGPGIPGFMGGGIMPGLGGGNAASNSLFMGQSNHNQSDISQILPNTDIPMPGQNRYPMHGLQTSNSQTSFGGSIYGNILPQTQVPENLADQWYYQDPTKIVQGPFSSKEMYSWYRAGFFSPSLMVRRACETHMRPLGTYGPVLPFAIGPPEIMPGFPISGGFEPRSQVPHDIMNIGGLSDSNPIESLQFGSVGMMRTPPFGQQQQMMESLWGQGASNTDALWMQQPVQNSQEEETEEQKKLQLNKLSMFFWDQE